jgi:hypothetical protein
MDLIVAFLGFATLALISYIWAVDSRPGFTELPTPVLRTR